MYITIHVRVDNQVDALRIAADHLSNGHWVAIEGLCDLDDQFAAEEQAIVDLSDDQTAVDIDQLVKRAAAPTERKPFIDARVPEYVKRQRIIDEVICSTCGEKPTSPCHKASGVSYGDGFVHAARSRSYYRKQAAS